MEEGRERALLSGGKFAGWGIVCIRPYSRSEVIHRAGVESIFSAFERERPRIVNNFAASAPSGYEFSSSSEEDELHETFEPWRLCLSRATNTQMRTNRLLRRLRLAIRNSHPSQARANDQYPRYIKATLEYE